MTDTKQTVHCISAKCFTPIAPNNWISDKLVSFAPRGL